MLFHTVVSLRWYIWACTIKCLAVKFSSFHLIGPLIILQLFQIFWQFPASIQRDIVIAILLLLFCIFILVESQQSFYTYFALKSFINISITLIFILTIKIFYCCSVFVLIIRLEGLLIEINTLTFFLGIYNLRGLVLIHADSVFIDWVHFETTLFKLNILEAVMNRVFFLN